MPKFRFQALIPGRRCVGKNADGSKRFETFTAAHSRKYADALNQMIKSKINIPVPWEHDPDAKPTTSAQRAKNTAGWVEMATVDANGIMHVDANIPDESDAILVRKVRFCSPRIAAFTDGNGKDWGAVTGYGNAITHLALTPRPVQHEQAPATQLAIQLSLDPYTGIDMAEKEGDEETPPKKKEGAEIPDGEVQPSGPAELKALITALAARGLIIPNEVKDLKELIIAIKSNANESPDANPGIVPTQGNTVEGVDKPIAMSLAEQKSNERASKQTRKELKARAAALFTGGVVSKPISLSLEQEADKVVIAFDDNGDMRQNVLSIKLDAYEAIKGGGRQAIPGRAERHPGVPSKASGLVELALPDELSGDMSDDKILAAFDAM